MRDSVERLPHAAVFQLMQRRLAPCVDWTRGMSGRRRQRRFFFHPLDNRHTATAVGLLLVVFLSSHLCATTYYVAKTGDDENVGSEEYPWLTVQYAVDQLEAGDTCWVKAGTYEEYDNLDITVNAGTATDPIVLKSYDGWSTTIVSNRVGLYEKHWSIEGFRILLDSTVPVQHNMRFSADSCAIRGCEIRPTIPHLFKAQGILVGSDADHGHVMDGNTIHGFGLEGADHGIYAMGHNLTITHNTIYDIERNGIQTSTHCESSEIAYNRTFDCGQDGLYIIGRYNEIHHNISYRTSHGLRLFASNLDMCHHNNVYNNVFYANRDHGLYIHAGPHTFHNNICFMNVRNVFVDTLGGGLNTFDYNCYYPDSESQFFWNGTAGGNYGNFQDWQDSTNQDSHSFIADPLFVDNASQNFRLTASSPCIDAGEPMTPPSLDFELVPTPQGAAVDIGAYEYHTFHPIQPTRDSARGAAPPAVDGRTFALAPNPLSGGCAALRCSLPKTQPATLSVFDVAGRRVLAQTTSGGAGTASLDLRKLKAGVYLVGVTTEGFSTTQKLVVER